MHLHKLRCPSHWYRWIYFVNLPKASPFTCALLCPQHLKLCLVCHGFAINTSRWMDESHSFLGWHRFKGYPVSNRLSFKSDVSVASIRLQWCVHASFLGSGWMWLPYTWIFFCCNRGSEGCAVEWAMRNLKSERCVQQSWLRESTCWQKKKPHQSQKISLLEKAGNILREGSSQRTLTQRHWVSEKTIWVL